MNMKLKILTALLLTVAICHTAGTITVSAQVGRLAKTLTPKFGTAARVAEAGAVTTVRFSRIPRYSITPVFNSAARSSLTRASITGAVRSNGIRRQFNATVGSLSRTPRALPAVSSLPSINSGSYTMGRTAAEMSYRQSFRQAADIRKLFSPHLPARVKVTLGKSHSVAMERAAAAKAMQTQAIAVERAFNQTARLHKNSLFYRAPSHAYVIVSPDGRLFKVGESSAGIMKNGLSKRAQAQVKKLNSELPTGSAEYRSRIIQTFDSKQDARSYERVVILRYAQRYPDRRVLPGNRERFRSR